MRCFERAGFGVVDADALGIEALTARLPELVGAFGASILNDEGQIDRALLGAKVFSDKKELAALNAISHPYIQGRINELIASSPERWVVINAALLPLIKVEQLTALVWVSAPFRVRFKRALARDRRPVRFVLGRIWAQRRLSVNLYYKMVDKYTIENRKGLEQLQQQSDDLVRQIKGVYDA